MRIKQKIKEYAQTLRIRADDNKKAIDALYNAGFSPMFATVGEGASRQCWSGNSVVKIDDPRGLLQDADDLENITNGQLEVLSRYLNSVVEAQAFLASRSGKSREFFENYLGEGLLSVKVWELKELLK